MYEHACIERCTTCWIDRRAELGSCDEGHGQNSTRLGSIKKPPSRRSKSVIQPSQDNNILQTEESADLYSVFTEEKGSEEPIMDSRLLHWLEQESSETPCHLDSSE